MDPAPRAHEALDLDGLPFWEGYLAWLRHHRPLLIGLIALLLVLFAAGLWASRAPQDAFMYDVY